MSCAGMPLLGVSKGQTNTCSGRSGEGPRFGALLRYIHQPSSTIQNPIGFPKWCTRINFKGCVIGLFDNFTVLTWVYLRVLYKCLLVSCHSSPNVDSLPVLIVFACFCKAKPVGDGLSLPYI